MVGAIMLAYFPIPAHLCAFLDEAKILGMIEVRTYILCDNKNKFCGTAVLYSKRSLSNTRYYEHSLLLKNKVNTVILKQSYSESEHSLVTHDI